MADTQEKILDIKVNYEKAVKAIAEYKKQIEAVKAEEKELEQQYKKGNISKEEYADKITLAKAKIADYNDSIRTTTKYLKNQIKQEQLQAGSLKALRAQLSNLTAEYDALSEAERKAAEGVALRDKINEVTKALKAAEEETQRYYRNVGNYENAIKNVLGLNSDFANSIMELASSKNGVSGFFNEAIGKAKAFSLSLLGLLKNPVFLALAGIAGAGMAFKWFYDYNKGIVEATRLTKQFTGLGEKELKEYRNEVQALADTYGKNFQEVLQATNSVAKRFGIEQSEALRIVKDGFIAGADANGEYLSTLKEYPAYFKEAGLSAEELVALTANATQEGIFSDKGIDAIKEANIRIREMTTATATAFEGIGMDSKKVQKELQSGAKTTFDIVQEVSARLNELPESSSEVGAALADIFGAMGEDAGLEYIKTLKDIDTNLDNVKSKAGALGKLQEQQLKSQVELENALSGLFDMTGGTFEEMTTKAKIFVNDGLVSIITGVQNLIQWFKGWYNESVALRGVIQGIGFLFSAQLQIAKFFFEYVITAAKSVGEVIRAAFTLDWEGMKKGVTDFFNGAVESGMEAGKNIAESMKSAWNETINGNTGTRQKTAPSGDSSSTVSGKTRPTASPADAEAAVKAKKKEVEEVRKMEDELLKLVKDEREKQTKAIGYEYDRQVEDLKARLNEETDLTSKAREAINTQIIALEQQKNQELLKLSDEETKKEIENRVKLISLQLEAVKEGSVQEYQLKRQLLISQRDAELAEEGLSEQMKLAITNKYNKQLSDLTRRHQKEISDKQAESIRLRMENELMQLQQSGASTLDMLREQARQKRELMDSIQKEEGESEEAFLNRKLQAQQEYLDAKRGVSEQEIEIEQAKADAMTQITGAMAGLLEQAGENNKAAAVAAKTLAIAEVAICQGVAIANAVKAATAGSKSIWEVVASIATAIATVVSTMASATKSIKSAKFAEGGLVTGPGTGTSDSIPARLSNGESVMTARATEMFAPILSSFNMMGGGVPINIAQSSNQSIGEDMLARAVAKGMMMAPAPQVSVEEFTSVANKVKFLENNGSL